jgi:hypothetical protein
LQQYTQFAEAAQNTTQLAQAQQYLTQALQQYAQTEATQVQSAEISAINNALQLNQLYTQRQQLMEQYSQQEQSILSGGVLTREETASASKAGQMEQLDQTYSQQMDQLDQQIAVSQYQYQTQQSIFGLATTQAGLQTQVVELQMNQIDQQNASIAAQENLVNLIRSTPASQLQTMPQVYQALGIPYSGPTAAQVGPQVGTLTATTPSYPINPQYPVYPTYPTTPTPPPWVYGPGGTVTTGPSIPVTTAPQPGTYNPAPGTPGSTSIFTTQPVEGYPATTGAYSTMGATVSPTTQPAYTTEQAALAYDIYHGGTASAPSNVGSMPVSEIENQPGATSPTTPIYYMQGTTGLIPVYNTPTTFDTGTGGGATGIVPGGNPAVIPSVNAQTGIGSNYPGTSAPLQDILAYPSMAGQATTLMPTGTTYSSGGSVPVGTPNVTFNTGTGVGSPTGAPPIPENPIGTTYASPMVAGMSLYGTDQAGNPIYVGSNGALYNVEGQQVGSAQATAPTVGTSTPTGISGLPTTLQRSLVEAQTIGTSTAAGISGTPVSGTTAIASMPQSLTLYGTDASGNPVYMNPEGALYNANGQEIGSAQPTPTTGVPATGGTTYSTMPATAVPTASQQAAGLLSVPNVPVNFNTGPTTAATNLGPVTGGGGPYIAEGASTPAGLMTGLIGAISTALKPIISPVASLPNRPTAPIVIGGAPGALQGSNPIVSGPFSGGGPTAPIVLGGGTNNLQGQTGTGPGGLQGSNPIVTAPGTSPIGISAASQAALNNAKLSTETQVTSMTSTRIAMETQLLAAKKKQSDADMQYVGALQQVMSSIASGNFSGLGNALSITNQATRYGGQQGPGAPTIEQNMYDLYRERGRYGSGGFSGYTP